jgi:hypothetical protein
MRRYDLHDYESADCYQQGRPSSRFGLGLYEAVKLAAFLRDQGHWRVVVARAGSALSEDEVYDSELGYLVDPASLVEQPAAPAPEGPEGHPGTRLRLSPLAAAEQGSAGSD